MIIGSDARDEEMKFFRLKSDPPCFYLYETAKIRASAD